jgi:ketosteroid isomerase-like protein
VSNAETVADWFGHQAGAWNAATTEWFAEHVWHPDVEWRAIEGAPDDVGLMQGPDRLRRYYGEWLELFEDVRNEVRQHHDIGECAVLAMHVTARARSTGMPLELNYAIVVELEDGRIRRGREYATLEDALRAAESDVRAT